jgi:hypothetical protein
MASWLGATTWGALPRIARLRDGAGAGRVLHSEWAALLSRFVDDAGLVDYRTLVRVQRLMETYLERLADTDPDAFADTDDQLAFYLNAYNAIAMYQVVQHYPVLSLRTVPGAWVRPFPVGRRNVSLVQLHGTLVRAFGDPRVHAALCPATWGGPILFNEPFVGTRLQAQLADGLRRLLADGERGARYDAATNTLYLAAPLVRWAGDWVYPQRMPRAWGLIAGRAQPQRFLQAIAPYMPPALAAVVPAQQLTVRALPYDWTLNEQPA